jgi:hypothetical protein
MSFSEQDAAARDIRLGNICTSFGEYTDTKLSAFIQKRLIAAELSVIDRLVVKPPAQNTTTSTGFLKLRNVKDHLVAIAVLRTQFGNHCLQVGLSRRIRDSAQDAPSSSRTVRIESTDVPFPSRPRRSDSPRRSYHSQHRDRSPRPQYHGSRGREYRSGRLASTERHRGMQHYDAPRHRQPYRDNYRVRQSDRRQRDRSPRQDRSEIESSRRELRRSEQDRRRDEMRGTTPSTNPSVEATRPVAQATNRFDPDIFDDESERLELNVHASPRRLQSLVVQPQPRVLLCHELENQIGNPGNES